MKELIRIVVSILGKNKYVIIGGVAVQAWGRPRLTGDVDIVITIPQDKIYDIVSIFFSNGFSIPKDARVRLQRGLAVKLKHIEGSVDLRIASYSIDTQALKRAKSFTIYGSRIRIASKEDLIVYKLARFDNRDKSDIETVLLRQLTLDFKYIQYTAEQLAIEYHKPQIIDNLSEIMNWERRSK